MFGHELEKCHKLLHGWKPVYSAITTELVWRSRQHWTCLSATWHPVNVHFKCWRSVALWVKTGRSVNEVVYLFNVKHWILNIVNWVHCPSKCANAASLWGSAGVHVEIQMSAPLLRLRPHPHSFIWQVKLLQGLILLFLPSERQRRWQRNDNLKRRDSFIKCVKFDCLRSWKRC